MLTSISYLTNTQTHTNSEVKILKSNLNMLHVCDAHYRMPYCRYWVMFPIQIVYFILNKIKSIFFILIEVI